MSGEHHHVCAGGTHARGASCRSCTLAPLAQPPASQQRCDRLHTAACHVTRPHLTTVSRPCLDVRVGCHPHVCGACMVVCWWQIVELLAIATRFGIPRLTNLCEAAIDEHISQLNVIELFDRGEWCVPWSLIVASCVCCCSDEPVISPCDTCVGFCSCRATRATTAVLVPILRRDRTPVCCGQLQCVGCV